MEGYEIIQEWFVRSAYSYIEGDKSERFWIDAQNCWYYLVCEETDGKTLKRLDGKKYWIIEPYKPIGLILTKENCKDVSKQIKWLVTDTSEKSDVGKEWDFDCHFIKR